MTSAILICVQLALYAVPGVECVTVILLCASYAFGAKFGFFTGLTFSLLRCILFGFYPSVIALYCIYFPLFGLIFGLAGRLNGERLPTAFKIGVNVLLAVLCAGAFCAAGFDLIKISRIYKETVDGLLWALGGIFAAMLIVFDGLWIACRKSSGENALKLFFITAVAAACTVCFTLLDDVISPLVIGMTKGGALAYFYASFTAMLPQTICTVITVGFTFYPLTAALNRAVK